MFGEPSRLGCFSRQPVRKLGHFKSVTLAGLERIRDNPRALFPRLKQLSIVIGDGLVPRNGSLSPKKVGVGGIVKLTDPEAGDIYLLPRDIDEIREYHDDFAMKNPDANNPEWAIKTITRGGNKVWHCQLLAHHY